MGEDTRKNREKKGEERSEKLEGGREEHLFTGRAYSGRLGRPLCNNLALPPTS